MIAIAQGLYEYFFGLDAYLHKLTTGNELLVKLRKMRTTADDDEDVVAAGPSSGSAQPAWMRTLYERSKEWLGQLPNVCIVFIMCQFPLLTQTPTDLRNSAEAVRRQPRPSLPLVCPRG